VRNGSRICEILVGAVGIEPTTFGLKVWLSLFPLFGISDLHLGYSVELRLFGLFWGGFRTFSVPNCTTIGHSFSGGFRPKTLGTR